MLFKIPPGQARYWPTIVAPSNVFFSGWPALEGKFERVWESFGRVWENFGEFESVLNCFEVFGRVLREFQRVWESIR